MFVRMIRTTLTIVAGLALLGVLGSTDSHAGIVAEDTISYPNGTLWGMNGGTGWTAYWNGYRTDVVDQKAVGRAPNQFYAVRDFENPYSTMEMFVSLEIRTPATVEEEDYFMVEFLGGVNHVSLQMGKTVGDARFAGGNAGFAFTDIPVLATTTYRLVGVYDLDQSLVSIWVNPDPSDYYVPNGGASSADASGNFNLHEFIQRVAVTSNLFDMTFDDVLVGDTPESVGLQSSNPTDAAEIASHAVGEAATTSSPNPCRDMTRFHFNLSVGGVASLAMFDVNGRLVEEAALGVRAAGVSEHAWSAAHTPAGVYFYEIRVDGARPVKGKLVVAR